jgi:hypothetical protein
MHDTDFRTSMNEQKSIYLFQQYTELQYIGPTYRDANFHRQSGSPVYVYSFDYLAPGAWPTLDPRFRDVAIPHGWELQYVYSEPGGQWHATSDDMATKTYLDTIWTNFIKFGYVSTLLDFTIPVPICGLRATEEWGGSAITHGQGKN